MSNSNRQGVISVGLGEGSIDIRVDEMSSLDANPISSYSIRAGIGDLSAIAEQQRRKKDRGWSDEEKQKFFGIPKPAEEAKVRCHQVVECIILIQTILNNVQIISGRDADGDGTQL
jgi:hypothetical protein